MRKRYTVSALAACCGALLVIGASIAQTPGHELVLTGHNDPVAIPSVGKILFAFIATLAVGVALLLLLRRVLPWLPKLAGQSSHTDTLRVVATSNVHVGLKLHVVEAAGATVLIAEGKAGLALLTLPPKQSVPDSDATHT